MLCLYGWFLFILYFISLDDSHAMGWAIGYDTQLRKMNVLDLLPSCFSKTVSFDTMCARSLAQLIELWGGCSWLITDELMDRIQKNHAFASVDGKTTVPLFPCMNNQLGYTSFEGNSLCSAQIFHVFLGLPTFGATRARSLARSDREPLANVWSHRRLLLTRTTSPHHFENVQGLYWEGVRGAATTRSAKQIATSDAATCLPSFHKTGGNSGVPGIASTESLLLLL